MYKNDAIIRIRYGETDQMGVVYHGNYYTWFEVGRSEFFHSLGYTYKKLEEEGIILPVIESSCQYLQPAKYYDEVIVRTNVESLKGVRIIFNYEIIRREDEVLLATGKTVHAFVDKDFKPVRIRKANERIWKLISGCLTEE